MMPQMNNVSISFDIFSLLTFYTVIASVFFIIIFKLINIEKSFKNNISPYNSPYLYPYQYNYNYFNNKILNIIEKYLNKDFESKNATSENNYKESKFMKNGSVNIDSYNFRAFFEQEANRNKNKSMKIAPDDYILNNGEYYIAFNKVVNNQPVTLINGGIYFKPEVTFPENVMVF